MFIKNVQRKLPNESVANASSWMPMVLSQPSLFHHRYPGLCGSTFFLWLCDFSDFLQLYRASSSLTRVLFVRTPMNFENTFGDVLRVYHRSEVARLQADHIATIALTIKKQVKSRLQCARKMQNVFWPIGKRLRFAGIKTADGLAASSPKAIQQGLISHWGPACEKKPIDLSAAKSLLDIYGRRHKASIKDFTKCVFPDKEV